MTVSDVQAHDIDASPDLAPAEPPPDPADTEEAPDPRVQEPPSWDQDAGDDVGQDAEDPGDQEDGRPGIAAGQLLVGGLLAVGLGGVGLYELAGPWGLAGGAAAAGGATYARLHRRREAARGQGTGHSRPAQVSSTLPRRLAALGGTTGGRRPADGPGGSARPAKARPGLLGSRSGRLAPRLDRPGLGDGRGRRAFGRLGGHGGGRAPAARSGAVRATSSGARAAGRVVRAAHAMGRGGTRTGLAIGRGARWAGGKAAGVARWPGRAVRSTRGKAARGLDKMTGRRASTAWRAAACAKGWKATRAASVGALAGYRRWDAQMAGGLVALVAWLTAPLRRRLAARKAQPAQPTENAETAGEANATGNPAITATAECPRCGTKHTVTLAADKDEITVTCGCGYQIRFFRHHPDTPKPAAPDPGSGEPDPTDRPAQGRSRSWAEPRRRTRMSESSSGFPLVGLSAEMHAAAASYGTDDMTEVAMHMDMLGEVPANVALAIRTITSRWEGEYPIDPTVIELLGELYTGLTSLVSVAEQVGPHFRTVHEADLARHEAPRTGEEKWNVG